MKHTFTFLTILLCFVTYSYASPHKIRHVQDIERVSNIVALYFPEHVATPLAKVALARQILEDGLQKGPDYSCAGTGVGGENGRIFYDTVFHWLKIGRASDGEGTFYTLSGEGAAICSAVVIARLYDTYVYRFMPKLRDMWDCVKRGDCNDDPLPIIERADRCYGPNHDTVRSIYR